MKSKLPGLFILTICLVVLVLLFFGCDVQFSSPQPVWVTKNQKVIPRNLRGNYLRGKDTIRITEKRIADNLKLHDIDFTLSDSVVLRIYKHLYFLNISNGNRKPWSLVLGKKEKDRIYYCILLSEDSIMLSRLKKITKVNKTKESDGQSTLNVIDPSPVEFRKILKSNLFAVVDTLTRVGK